MRRFLAAQERLRAQRRLDLMQAINAGMAGGEAYTTLAENLIGQLTSSQP